MHNKEEIYVILPLYIPICQIFGHKQTAYFPLLGSVFWSLMMFKSFLCHEIQDINFSKKENNVLRVEKLRRF